MKRNLGSVLALYPTPAVVVGTFVQEKVNWVLVAHVGIIGHNRILVSLAKPHFTNQGIKATGRLSVNIVDESFLPTADFMRTLAKNMAWLLKCIEQGKAAGVEHPENVKVTTNFVK